MKLCVNTNSTVINEFNHLITGKPTSLSRDVIKYEKYR